MKSRFSIRIIKYIQVASVVIAVGIALIWLILQGYSVAWTGFGDFTKPDGEFVRGKTLWDWMQLFIIPIFLSIGVFFLNRAERDNEREIAADRQREIALQTYFDRMADLLLKEKLRTSKNKEAQNVARIRTLTLLRGLDGVRKGIVVKFLQEAGLITIKKVIVSLEGANLEGADLVAANLQSVYLARTNLMGASLVSANLEDANLEDAYMWGVRLVAANLEGAILDGATVTNNQLAEVNSLKDARMPDGTIHE